MKTLKSYIVGIMALAAATVGLSACQDHFDDPTSDIAPVANKQANTTIAEVKQMLWQESNNYCNQIDTKANGDHYIVSGRVVSSDYAGNCFKYIVLQDETGALNFSINSYNLYLNYRRGQEVVVDLTGLYGGKYRGLLQIGYPSFNSSIQGDETSFMAPEFFSRNKELNGWPEPAKIDTTVVNSFGELGVTPDELMYWQSRIVRFNNVEFVPNTTTPTLSTYHSSGITQQIRDASGNTLDVRTSGYANFWNMELPEGKCDVVALMGYYVSLANSGGWQLTLIDANSIMNLGNPTVPAGSEGKPYDVLQAIALQVNDKDKSGWVKGYMVGTVAHEVTEVKSNADIEWGTEATLNNTLVVGQTPETTDYRECLIISLPQGSSLRANGALRENPDNYKKEIELKGTFASVMGTYGITGNKGTTSEYKIEGKGGGEITAGDGTEEKPYTVAQIRALNPQSTTEAVESGVWVKGYIVGSMPTGGSSTTLSGAEFSTKDAAVSNIVVAPTADCTDPNLCIGIQLPTDANAPGVRSALNLKDNPGNLGRQVELKGDVMKYCGGPGLKNTSAYKLGEGGSDTPVVPPVTGDGDGTEAKPYSASQIIALNPTSTTTAVATGVWAEGYIVGSIPTGGSSTVISGTTFGTADAAVSNLVLGPTADCKDYNQCIAVQLPTDANAPGVRSALNLKDNPGNLGKKATVKGDVMKYCGGPGIKNTRAYKLDGQGMPDTPDTPSGDGTVLLGQKNPDGAKDWTFNNVSLPSGLTDIWTWKDYNSAYYLNASAYANGGANASEAWAISPVIDLTKASGVSVSFSHAAKFQTTLKSLCGFAVKEDGASGWTMLTIPTWPEAGSWTWSNSGNISLANYSGKKIQVAFKYGSSSSGADTWEIRDLTFAGSGTITVGGAGSTTPDTPDTPPTPSGNYKGDFDSFNGGTPKSSYGSYTNATGWTLENGAVLAGQKAGEADSNPRFAFIGGETTMAPTLNGNTTKVGKLTSPTLKGGCKTLSFYYGFAFNETKCAFTVQVLQGGKVVKEQKVELTSIEKAHAYQFSLDVNVSGDFQIVITNDCLSAATKNSDRVSIWNLTWTD